MYRFQIHSIQAIWSLALPGQYQWIKSVIHQKIPMHERVITYQCVCHEILWMHSKKQACWNEIIKPNVCTIHGTWPSHALSSDVQLNLAMPCLVLQVMSKGQHQNSHSSHASLWKWWLRGNIRHTIWPCLAVQAIHMCYSRVEYRLNMAMACWASTDRGAALAKFKGWYQ